MNKNIKLLQGNEACVEGALAAGMEFFAGYPITPSTEIAEISAQKLPAIGGHFIQMEDEIAGMAATLGGSLTGKKSMTATSGPGFSLKQENIGYGCIAEIPCVIVNVQRGGPSTGLPTSPAQSDIMQAKWGTHGDHPVIALYPNSVQEIFTTTVDAFNMAEKYRTPVILLLDEIIGHMREKIDLSIVDSLEIIDRKRPSCTPEEYKAYQADEDLIPPMADFGSGYRYHVTGLMHDETGFPSNNSKVAHQLMHRLMDKIDKNVEDIVKYEEYMLEDAEIAFVAFGATSRAAKEAIDNLRKKGIKIGLFRPITIWPSPQKQLLALSEKVNTIIVAEMNMGQYTYEVERIAAKNCNVEFYGRVDGQPINPDELMKFAEEVLL
ncbi:MAG: 2-oxoacid:acceptor oxidoreductase subunit alpha [Tissierellales bacterium]|nr:2-oxoacid:acceptor oxidoreductase subunit alpha [Tissierellales bacterium]MBN2826905.1 2-oxoacid:acceptor oxidoreductase subunit alpha [Tissierellales bacterium]